MILQPGSPIRSRLVPALRAGTETAALCAETASIARFTARAARNTQPYQSIRSQKEIIAMVSAKKTLKICPKGHKFYKSSDCPTCPTCDAENKPETGFLSKLGNPARNALEAQGITTLTELAKYSEREILKLHGIGPRSIPTLRQALMDAGLSFNDA